MAKKRPTLEDVSRLAGVSSATVSRVLNGTGPVSEAVRLRAEEAINSLQYRRKKTETPPVKPASVAVLTHNLTNPFFVETLNGILDEVDHYGMIMHLDYLTDSPLRQGQLMKKLKTLDISGLIVMGSQPFPALVEWQQKEKLPLVLINRSLNLPYVHCLGVDFENALYRATWHLLNLGHKRFGIISMVEYDEIYTSRQRGIVHALEEAGLILPAEICVSVPVGGDADGGYHAMKLILDLPPDRRPTAILAFNDVIAMGAMRAVHMAGLHIPRDLSIVGVDDIASASFTCPPLTTVSQPKAKMGSLAVKHLLDMRRTESDRMIAPSCSLIESPLIVRESTGPAPG